MIRIAICDDKKYICTQLKDILVGLGLKLLEEIDIDIFYSGEELYEAVSKDVYYHIIFLDIELEIMDGIEVGNKIRNQLFNESTQIIYISGKDSYAMELFKVRPLDFIIKPLDNEKIEKALVLALRLIDKSKGNFKYKFESSTYNLLIKDILYFESKNRQVKIYTQNGIKEFYGTLIDTFDKVKDYDFVKIHKSYLINYNHVIKFEYHQVTMSDKQVLPISQSNRKDFRALQLERERNKLWL